MRIAIDCADLDHQRIDGTRVYIKKLLDWFGRIDNENEFLLYHQKDFNPLLKPKNYKNYTERKIPYDFWWTQTRLPFELKKDKPDVLWMPIQQLPYLSRKDNYNKVVTIHDLAFKIYSKFFPAKDRFKLNLFTDYAIKRADKIIAVSYSTKNDILKFYPKIREDKIKVVYHGVDKTRSLRPRAKNDNSKPRVLIAGIKNHKYILYLGAIQPRKNLITLVKSFELLKAKKESSLKLVIAGESAWQAEPILKKIKKSEYSQDIILTGQVSFKEASELYQNAEMFVLPSLYEGFGMPLLEAWEEGLPVIIADNSSLSEIGEDAVEKFDGKNIDELAKKIKLILNDNNRKMELIEKGKRRLENFNWEKCVRETLAILK